MASKTNNITPTDENATLTVAQVMQEVNYKKDLSDLRSRLTAIASPAKSRMSDEQTEQLAEKNVPALEKTQMGIAITKACRGFYAEALRYARDNGYLASSPSTGMTVDWIMEVVMDRVRSNADDAGYVTFYINDEGKSFETKLRSRLSLPPDTSTR